MSSPDGQAVADYSRGNRGSRDPAAGSAKPNSRAGEGAASDAAAGSRGARLRGRGGSLRLALMSAGVAGALALIVADLSTLYQVKVGSIVLSSVSGHQQHSFALLLLGLGALIMLAGAARGALPAMLAVAALGVAAIFAGPVGDDHDVHSVGVIGDAYAGSSAQPGIGYRLEVAGSALLVLSGGGLALISAGPARAARRERRARKGREREDAGAETPARLAANPYAGEEQA